MNFIDIIIVILLGYAAVQGFKKGFVIGLFTFLALFIGLYAGIHFSDFVSNIFRQHLGVTSENLPVISFIIIFLAVGAMVYFLGIAIEKVIKVIQLSLVNKLFGAFFSVLKMAFILGAIILIVESYNENNDVISEETKSNSLLYYPFKKFITLCIPAFDESTLFLKNTLTRDDLGPEIMEEELSEAED